MTRHKSRGFGYSIEGVANRAFTDHRVSQVAKMLLIDVRQTQAIRRAEPHGPDFSSAPHVSADALIIRHFGVTILNNHMIIYVFINL
jgi:hypothetical protein